MKNINLNKLRAGTALHALALLGTGAAGTVAFAAPAFAQDYTNVTASGRVIGTNGEAVPGATVTITSDQGLTRTVTTDGSGAFRIPQVPTGTYSFNITAEGFSTYSEQGIALTQNEAANQFALVPAGAAGEEIVVTGGRVRVADFERTTTGAVISVADLANRVPVARNLNSIIQLAPGTTVGGAASNAAFRGLSSIGGGSVAENVFYVNGLNITEFRQGLGAVDVPFDFYETVEVKNGGYQAEFGRATGGVVNAITKSGSNDFHASAQFIYEPNSLQEDAKNTIENDNDGDFSERTDAIFQVSGPIIKDHLFFYGLYNARNVKTGDGTTPLSAATNLATYDTRSNTSPFYGGKIDAVLFDGHRLEATYFNSQQLTNLVTRDYDPATNQQIGYQGTTKLITGGENFVGRYTGTFAQWLTVSAAYGKNHRRQDQSSSTPDRPYVLDTRTGVDQVIGNIASSERRNFDTREFYRADVDLYFNAFGSHHIRAGYDQEDLTSETSTITNGGASYTIYRAGANDDYGFAPGTEYFGSRLFTNGGSFSTQNKAFYIQDSWSLFDNRLNLQLGVRNDRFENRNANGETFYASGDQWGPRAGFTADPFGDGRSKVYGSFGRYFLPIFGNTNIRGAGVEYDVTSYYELAGLTGAGIPVAGAPGVGIGTCLTGAPPLSNCEVIRDGTITPTDTTVAKNLKPQSMDEYIIGAEQRIGGRWRVGANFTYRTLNRALEDVAIDQAVLAYCTANSIAGCGGPGYYTGFHQYVLVNPGQDATITLLPLPNGESPTVNFTADQLGYPEAKREYKAVTVQFEREFDGAWSLAGSYTWTSLKGNYEGAVKSDNGQVDAGATTDFDQPGFVNGAYGSLPNERVHNFKLYGSYAVADWFTIGANALLQSPRKFGCIGRVPASVDPFARAYGAAGNYCFLDGSGNVITDAAALPAGATPSLVPRGTAFKSDWYSQVNLSLGFRVPAPEGIDATLRVDVFNVFNQKAALDFEERGTTDAGQPFASYRSPLVYQTPRYFRFNLGFAF